MKTKIVSLILCLAVVFNLLPAVNLNAEEKFTKDGITYEINSSKPDEVSIVQTDNSLENLKIEKYLTSDDGSRYTVDLISAGSINNNVKTITLPIEGVSIEPSAFCGLTELIAVNNMDKTNIQSSDLLFYDCTHLIETSLPETLETVGNSMFFNCRSLRNCGFVNDALQKED